MNLDCVIWHDGTNWIAENGFLSVAAPTIEALDQGVGEALKRKSMLKKGDRLRVFMAFDNSTIPQWMRQYAQHYFNRVVEIEG